MLDGRWRRGHDPNLPGLVGLASHASLSRPWPPASLPRSAHGCRSRFLLWPESLALSLGAHRHTRLQHSTTQLRLFAGQRGMSAYVPSALIGRPHPLYACIRALTPPLHHSFSSNASPPQLSSSASPPQLLIQRLSTTALIQRLSTTVLLQRLSTTALLQRLTSLPDRDRISHTRDTYNGLGPNRCSD